MKGGHCPCDGNQESRIGENVRGQAAGMRSTKIPLKEDPRADRGKRDITWSDRNPVFDDRTDDIDAEHQEKARSSIENSEVAEFLIKG